MASVSIADAETRLGELIAQAQSGEDVTITDDGRPVARLVAEAKPVKKIDTELLRRTARRSKSYVDPDGLSFVERMRRENEL